MRARVVAAIAAALLATACTEPFVGAPSLTLVSTAETSRFYQPIGSVRRESLCTSTYLFLFGAGDPPSHEAAIAKLLAETGADVLLNARLTRDRVSLLLYSSDCAVVKGQPARRVEATP